MKNTSRGRVGGGDDVTGQLDAGFRIVSYASCTVCNYTVQLHRTLALRLMFAVMSTVSHTVILGGERTSLFLYDFQH